MMGDKQRREWEWQDLHTIHDKKLSEPVTVEDAANEEPDSKRVFYGVGGGADRPSSYRQITVDHTSFHIYVCSVRENDADVWTNVPITPHTARELAAHLIALADKLEGKS